jgi:hypothetical protein
MPRSKKPNRLLRVSAIEHAKMQAEMLVTFLNSPGVAGHSLVLEALQLCHQLHQLRSTAPAVYPKKETEAIWRFMRKRESLLRALNKILEPFQFTPMLAGGHTALERYSVDWRAFMAIGNGARVRPGGEVVIPAVSALKLALELLVSGMLDRIRQCHCNKWFFAASNKKNVCGDACRHQQFRQKDGFKASRAIYMKKYRQELAAEKARKRRAKRSQLAERIWART